MHKGQNITINKSCNSQSKICYTGGMSLANLKLGMGLNKSLYQKVSTKYVPLDGIDIKNAKVPLVLLLLVGLFMIWGKDV